MRFVTDLSDSAFCKFIGSARLSWIPPYREVDVNSVTSVATNIGVDSPWQLGLLNTTRTLATVQGSAIELYCPVLAMIDG